MVEALTTGIGQIATTITSALIVVIPIALTIAGGVMAVRFGVRWFKSLAK